MDLCCCFCPGPTNGRLASVSLLKLYAGAFRDAAGLTALPSARRARAAPGITVSCSSEDCKIKNVAVVVYLPGKSVSREIEIVFYLKSRETCTPQMWTWALLPLCRACVTMREIIEQTHTMRAEWEGPAPPTEEWWI